MPLDESVLDKIDDVVEEWIAADKMFSAFEVSLEVRKRGIQERHRNMKESVHASISEHGDGKYTRTLMDVGAPVHAWVYHALTANPYTYQGLPRNDGPARTRAVTPRAAAIRNPTPLSANAAAPATATDGAYGTNADGQVTVPASLLSKIQVGPGQSVALIADPDEQTMTIKPLAAADGEFEEEQAASNGDLILTPEALEHADLDWMQCYRIDSSSGSEIIISEF